MELLRAFSKLYSLFDKKEKQSTRIMLVLIILGALVETVGVGIILPFVSYILNPQIIDKYQFFYRIYQCEMIGTYPRFVVMLCILMILLFLLKTAYMIFLLFMQNRYSLNRQVMMAKRLFSAYINKPYEFFFGKNSSELQRNVNILVPKIIDKFLIPALSLFTELLVVVFIFLLLVIVDPVSALIIAAVLGMIGMIYYYKVKRQLTSTSKSQNLNLIQMNKYVQEGIASIKEIKVMERETNFIGYFDKNSKEYARTQASYSLINQAPRILIESIVVCGIVIVVLVNILLGNEMDALLPVLSLFAMAAIRIMPSMTRILNHLTNLKFNMVNIDLVYDDVLENLNSKNDQSSSVEMERVHLLKKGIEIRNLSYRYPNTEEDVLNDVCLTIKKGQVVGIVGQSGAGKTTLIDLILGLLKPTAGSIFADGVDIQEQMSVWRKNLGYVPQNVYLLDDTIEKNVAFGVDDKLIDEDKVWAALGAAQMKEFVQKLPRKLDALVGQDGILLSGGQRQRIGIARALYHDPDILILDEATSALDTGTEEQISDAITAIGKSKTLIIIAHRKSTLKKCDVIYKIDGRKVHDQNVDAD